MQPDHDYSVMESFKGILFRYYLSKKIGLLYIQNGIYRHNIKERESSENFVNSDFFKEITFDQALLKKEQ